jgi:UDP-glucose 4-epimerase
VTHYLITGGAGFIGSHLADELIRQGHTVSVIDDLSTGSLANIEQLLGHPRFRHVIESCANHAVMTELVASCDAVFHLAAAVGVKLVVDSVVRMIESNILLTDVVLSLASEKAKPVLFASSSEVYGKSDRIPFRENADLVLGANHRWSYACTKALGEYLALARARENGLPVVIARLFNTVGPRQTGKWGMVMPAFVRDGLLGRPIRVFGDGTQTRCFVHVTDVVRALIGLLESRSTRNEVYNVGSADEISIRDLAALVRARTGGRSELAFVPYDEAYATSFEDLARRVPDISKIEAAIGWKPAIALSQIVDDVIADHRDRPQL